MTNKWALSLGDMLDDAKRARAKSRKRAYLYRSARTGRFVSAKYAKRYPSITVRETKYSFG